VLTLSFLTTRSSYAAPQMRRLDLTIVPALDFDVRIATTDAI
jgi:hypothetical protein